LPNVPDVDDSAVQRLTGEIMRRAKMTAPPIDLVLVEGWLAQGIDEDDPRGGNPSRRQREDPDPGVPVLQPPRSSASTRRGPHRSCPARRIPAGRGSGPKAHDPCRIGRKCPQAIGVQRTA
jgi:hypothetical protein